MMFNFMLPYLYVHIVGIQHELKILGRQICSLVIEFHCPETKKTTEKKPIKSGLSTHFQPSFENEAPRKSG